MKRLICYKELNLQRKDPPPAYFDTFPENWREFIDKLIIDHPNHRNNELSIRLLRQNIKSKLEAEVYAAMLDGCSATAILESHRLFNIFDYIYKNDIWPFFGMGASHCDASLSDLGPFPDISIIEGSLNVAKQYEIILDELNRVRRSIRAETREFIYTGTWRSLDIWSSGEKESPAEDMFANTIDLMRSIKVFNTLYEYSKLNNPLSGYFIRISSLKPDTIILPHFGITNTRVRIQIPLIIPDGELFIYCHNQKRSYEYGTPIILNDSYIHGVKNQADGDRVILLADLPHPSASLDQLKDFRDG
ncbi:Aspartyl/Asparaginyl beta-hydroxylase [Prochlorococcus sp. MIT 1303]|nr:Aspartyl/Asparaginyl beta-hydroxylase [Prochlorococcus sp. MIT 1303]